MLRLGVGSRARPPPPLRPAAFRATRVGPEDAALLAAEEAAAGECMGACVCVRLLIWMGGREISSLPLPLPSEDEPEGPSGRGGKGGGVSLSSAAPCLLLFFFSLPPSGGQGQGRLRLPPRPPRGVGAPWMAAQRPVTGRGELEGGGVLSLRARPAAGHRRPFCSGLSLCACSLTGGGACTEAAQLSAAAGSR